MATLMDCTATKPTTTEVPAESTRLLERPSDQILIVLKSRTALLSGGEPEANAEHFQ